MCEYNDGYEVVNNYKDFFVTLRQRWVKPNFKISYQPRDGKIFKAVDLIQVLGNCSLIFEEIHLAKKSYQDALYKVFTLGRHKNLSVVGTAQRPARVHRDLTAQSDLIVSLRQTEPNDLKYLREYSSLESEEEFEKLKN